MRSRFAFLLLVSAFLLFPINAMAEDLSWQSGNSREDRLSKEVATQKITLDDNAKALLQAKCQNAQNVLRAIQEESDKVIRQRIDTYSNIQKELQAIKLRMIRQGSDASETDLLTGKLQQELDKLTIQANIYGVSLDDAIGVDCQQKPEQFKAALIMMRAQRAELFDIAGSLKSTILDSDDTIFTQLKKRLTI